MTITVHFDPFFQQPPMELEHAPAKPHGAGGGSATAEHAVVLWDPASTDKPKPPTETELRCARLLQRRWRRAQIQAKATAFLDGAGDGVVFGAAAHAFSTAAFGERGKLRMGQKGASQRDVMAYGDMREMGVDGRPEGRFNVPDAELTETMEEARERRTRQIQQRQERRDALQQGRVTTCLLYTSPSSRDRG